MVNLPSSEEFKLYYYHYYLVAMMYFEEDMHIFGPASLEYMRKYAEIQANAIGFASII